MQGRRWRWTRIGLGLALALALGVGCSRGDGEKTSRTPRIESTAEELEPGLLTLSQVRAALDAPRYRRTSSEGLNLRGNPDPRGPCGAKVPQPSLRHGALASFRNRSSALATMVVEPGELATKRYLDAIVADSRPGCAAFDSTTNFGETQHVVPILVPLPPLADGAVASAGLVTIGDGPRTLLVEIIVRDGDRMAFTGIISGTDIPASKVVALARESAKALESLDRNSA